MPADEESVTNGELYRSLSDLKIELRDLKSGFVPRGEYQEHSKAQGERVGAVERGVSRVEGTLASINRIAWGAIIMGIAVPVLVAVLIVNLGLR